VVTAVGGADCWIKEIGFTPDLCCMSRGKPHADNEYGCWDKQFDYSKCCSDIKTPAGGIDVWGDERKWSAFAESAEGDLDWSRCTEFVRAYDWQKTNATDFEVYKYRSCVNNFRKMSSPVIRPAALSGEHFPTVIMPAGNLYWVLPVYDHVVGAHIKKYGTYDPAELKLFKKYLKTGGTFVDIGANLGAYSIPLAVHVGQKGIVYSFEPFNPTFQLLTANAALNGLLNVQTFQRALGDTNEVVTALSPDMNNPSNLGMMRVYHQFKSDHAKEIGVRHDGEQDVHVDRLDDYAHLFKKRGINLIKIDAEGHQLQVLSGGAEVIRKHRPYLAIEDVWKKPKALLESWGYACTLEISLHEMWICAP
jgi:FkbM family methyltransferase